MVACDLGRDCAGSRALDQDRLGYGTVRRPHDRAAQRLRPGADVRAVVGTDAAGARDSSNVRVGVGTCKRDAAMSELKKPSTKRTAKQRAAAAKAAGEMQLCTLVKS